MLAELTRSTVSEVSIGAVNLPSVDHEQRPNCAPRARRAFDALAREIAHWSGRCRRQAAALVELKYVADGRPADPVRRPLFSAGGRGGTSAEVRERAAQRCRSGSWPHRPVTLPRAAQPHPKVPAKRGRAARE
jgi:hypothetical protein